VRRIIELFRISIEIDLKLTENWNGKTQTKPKKPSIYNKNEV
jgi:hypothetical protein